MLLSIVFFALFTITAKKHRIRRRIISPQTCWNAYLKTVAKQPKLYNYKLYFSYRCISQTIDIFIHWTLKLIWFQAFRGSRDREYAINNDFTIYRCCFTGKWNWIGSLRLDYNFFSSSEWLEKCFNPIGITSLLNSK